MKELSEQKKAMFLLSTLKILWIDSFFCLTHLNLQFFQIFLWSYMLNWVDGLRNNTVTVIIVYQCTDT